VGAPTDTDRRIIKILLALLLAGGAVAAVTASSASATPLSQAAAAWACLPARQPIDDSNAVPLSRATSGAHGSGPPWCGRNGFPGNTSHQTPQLLTMHATRL